MFRSLPSVVAATLVAVGLSQSPAAAQELANANALASTVLYGAVPMAPVPASVTVTAAAAVATSAESATGTKFYRAFVAPKPAETRPMVLPALYVMQGALQVLDVRSTMVGLSLGAHEANPMMQPFAKSPAAMIAIKAGVAASTIWASEKMWRGGNRAGAIASMVIANSLMAVVVAHNYRLVNQLQQ
jgi:hypothetical protein